MNSLKELNGATYTLDDEFLRWCKRKENVVSEDIPRNGANIYIYI